MLCFVIINSVLFNLLCVKILFQNTSSHSYANFFLNHLASLSKITISQIHTYTSTKHTNLHSTPPPPPPTPKHAHTPEDSLNSEDRLRVSQSLLPCHVLLGLTVDNHQVAGFVDARLQQVVQAGKINPHVKYHDLELQGCFYFPLQYHEIGPSVKERTQQKE